MQTNNIVPFVKKVQYKFFKKPISNKHVILAKSAFSGGVNRATFIENLGDCPPSPEHWPYMTACVTAVNAGWRLSAVSGAQTGPSLSGCVCHI